MNESCGFGSLERSSYTALFESTSNIDEKTAEDADPGKPCHDDTLLP